MTISSAAYTSSKVTYYWIDMRALTYWYLAMTNSLFRNSANYFLILQDNIDFIYEETQINLGFINNNNWPVVTCSM